MPKQLFLSKLLCYLFHIDKLPIVVEGRRHATDRALIVTGFVSGILLMGLALFSLTTFLVTHNAAVIFMPLVHVMILSALVHLYFFHIESRH